MGPSSPVPEPADPEPDEQAARVRATAESVATAGRVLRIIHIFLDVFGKAVATARSASMNR
jgi:hypothetical protein